MIQGIPYFGENTQEIYEFIQSNRYDEAETAEVNYESLYELIYSNIGKKIIVVLDNECISWLNDIVFNYRDKVCYMPYYEYKTFEICDKSYRSNNNGHLILNGNHLLIRYEYNYKKLYINENKLLLNCIDLDTMKKLKLTTECWMSRTGFSLDELYELYINSCYKDDDYLMNKHMGGYHYIERSPVGFKNKEKKLREQYELKSYSEDFVYESDYRDVRQYSYDEMLAKYGLLSDTRLYKLRRLQFDAYLFCAARQGFLNNLQFKHGIYKIGNDIKLIIKKYWIDGENKPEKTYIR